MLQIVATPIGHPDDITIRAIQALRDSEIIIGEEFRQVSTLLKKLKIENKEIFLLNEHSQKSDIYELADLCKVKTAALVSDCGTPVFADPGADLIAICRRNGVRVTSLPGASSLMTLLSLSSKKLSQFLFVGFLPAKKEDRQTAILQLKKETRDWIVMDTPYRFHQLLTDLAQHMPNEKALVGANLTLENELVLEGTFSELLKKCPKEAHEFMILKYGPTKT